MSIWREFRDLAVRSTWVERFVVTYTVAMAVFSSAHGDWSHASTYLLAAACATASVAWRLAALDAEHSARQWRRMFYDLRAMYAARDAKRDAGHVTVGQALGVVLLTVAFLAAMAFVGAVETAGLS